MEFGTDLRGLTSGPITAGGKPLRHTRTIRGSTFSFTTAAVRPDIGDWPAALAGASRWDRVLVADNADSTLTRIHRRTPMDGVRTAEGGG